MNVKLTVRQVQEQLPELLQRAVEAGEECVVQRDGHDYAVIVGVREWKRRRIGARLDSLGSAFRLTKSQQQRTEVLLAESQQRRLTRTERRELDALLQVSEEVLLRRTAALDRLS